MEFKFYLEVKYNTVIAVTNIKASQNMVWAVASDDVELGLVHREAVNYFYILNECMPITEETARMLNPKMFEFLANEREEYYPRRRDAGA